MSQQRRFKADRFESGCNAELLQHYIDRAGKFAAFLLFGSQSDRSWDVEAANTAKAIFCVDSHRVVDLHGRSIVHVHDVS